MATAEEELCIRLTSAGLLFPSLVDCMPVARAACLPLVCPLPRSCPRPVHVRTSLPRSLGSSSITAGDHCVDCAPLDRCNLRDRSSDRTRSLALLLAPALTDSHTASDCLHRNKRRWSVSWRRNCVSPTCGTRTRRSSSTLMLSTPKRSTCRRRFTCCARRLRCALSPRLVRLDDADWNAVLMSLFVSFSLSPTMLSLSVRCFVLFCFPFPVPVSSLGYKCALRAHAPNYALYSTLDTHTRNGHAVVAVFAAIPHHTVP